MASNTKATYNNATPLVDDCGDHGPVTRNQRHGSRNRIRFRPEFFIGDEMLLQVPAVFVLGSRVPSPGTLRISGKRNVSHWEINGVIDWAPGFLHDHQSICGFKISPTW